MIDKKTWWEWSMWITRDSSVAILRKKESLYDMMCLIFKNICEENRRTELAKIPYLLTEVLLDLF